MVIDDDQLILRNLKEMVELGSLSAECLLEAVSPWV